MRASHAEGPLPSSGTRASFALYGPPFQPWLLPRRLLEDAFAWLPGCQQALKARCVWCQMRQAARSKQDRHCVWPCPFVMQGRSKANLPWSSPDPPANLLPFKHLCPTPQSIPRHTSTQTQARNAQAFCAVVFCHMGEDFRVGDASSLRLPCAP